MSRDTEISLRSTLGAIASGATLDDALRVVVEQAVESLGVIAAKIWLVKQGDMCDACPLAGECQDRSMCLHLRASVPGDVPESPRVPLVVFRDRIAARGGGGRLSDSLAGALLFRAEVEAGLAHGVLALVPLKGPSGVLGLLGAVRDSPMTGEDLSNFKALGDAALVAIRIADLTSRFQRASMKLEEAGEDQYQIEGLLHAILYGSTEYNVIAEDLQGNILVFSEGARTTYGYTPEEVIGRVKADVLYAPEEVESGKIVEILNEAMRTGRCEALVGRIKKNGDRFPARATFTIRRDAEGDPCGFVVVERDLSTERNSARLSETAARQVAQMEDHLRDLKASHARLESETAELRARSEALARMLAETENRARGEIQEIKARKETLEREAQSLAREAERAREFEDLVEIRATTIERLRERIAELSASLAASVEASAGAASLVAETPDVSTSARSIDPRPSLLGGLAHEMRSALSGIAGLATMALDAEGETSGRQHDVLRRIVRNAQSLLIFSNNALDAARIALEQFEVYLEDIDLREIVGSACSAVEAVAGDRSIVIDALALGEPVQTRTDGLKLRQALANAIVVALDCTRNDFVLVSVEMDDWSPCLCVRAGGGRIPDAVVEFPEGAGVSPSGTSLLGTGLAFWVARRILESLGGRLAVAETDGAVEIRLILGRDTSLQAARAMPAEILGKVIIFSGAVNDGAMLAAATRRAGFEPIVLDNAEQAMALARAAAVDLVFVDVDVPSGWELLADLSRKERRDITISVGGANQRGRALMLGSRAFLARPVEAERAAAAIHRVVRRVAARVTLIEDDEDAQVILSAMLDHPAYRLTLIGDGELALVSLVEQRPDLVVLDICLPRVDGFGILRDLAADSDLRSMPVVLVTAKDVTSDERNRLGASVAAILQKGSFGREQLLAAIDRALYG